MKKLLFVFTILLWHLNVFSQTFQKAIYKHANEINDGRGITNRYLFSDSVGTTKWHHSISVEAQLHNNYLYKSDYLKVVTYYKNSFLGDSTNESGYLPSYKIYTSFYNRKFTFSIGASYSIYQFTSDYPDSRTELWRYKIMSMHFMSGLFKSYKNLLINYIIEFHHWL
jgi:hypothetical protein